MSTKREVLFVLYVLVCAMFWVPISAWLMPRLVNAPTWDRSPMFFVSATMMGVVLAYAWKRKRCRLRLIHGDEKPEFMAPAPFRSRSPANSRGRASRRGAFSRTLSLQRH